MRTGGSFGGIIAYFRNSRFEHLALDYAGGSIRLSRDTHEMDVAATGHIEVRAPTVGLVELPPGRARFPEAGDRVAENEVLFAIRRFRNVVTVSAAAGGTLDSVLVSEGIFVEFAQPLATVSRAT